ncbi:hypothetical protein [Achromobacter marplatensis]|uniref:hypothetical protein n=1 Tax=Achromobacter marplatensis TaxID=470868 RepID=UPI0039F71D7F
MSDKTVYVAVQMKDGAIYVGTAALVGIAAASDAVGNWVSEFVGNTVERETALPGKPGEVVRVDTLPPLPSEKETLGSEIPSWPGDAVGPIAVPGQENNGPSGGTTTTTPLPDEQGPGLIFSNGPDATNNAIPEGVSFGRNLNQDSHVWRHVEDELGMNRKHVQDAVLADLPSISNLSDGLNVRFVIVGGVRLQYNAFKLPDGTVNIGRIHEAN